MRIISKSKMRFFAALMAALMALVAISTVSAQTPRSATATLATQNNSGISGTATLTDNGNNTTTVVIKTTGQPAGNVSPVHIHDGTCTNLTATPKYPLTNIENNTSTTTVNASLATILAGPVAINSHKSPQEVAVYTSCGNIVAAAAGGQGGGSPAAPASGTGGLSGDNGLWPLFLLGGLLVLGAGVGATLYARRNTR